MKCFTLTQNRQGKDTTLPFLRLQGEPYIQVGATGGGMKVPIRDDMVRIFNGLKSHGEKEVHLERVDLKRGKPATLTPEHDPANDACLVHVDLTHDGQFWYEANTYNEIIYQERRGEKVRRAYRPFTDARGIHVVAHGSGPHGEPQALLHMLPGASFRLCRDTIDRSPVLVVAWPGTKLKVITPTKFKKALQDFAA